MSYQMEDLVSPCQYCGCDPEANHTCERHRGNLTERIQSVPLATTPIRTFDTGATRNLEEGKYDYEAFLSPLVLERFAAYMHANRLQADGTLRDGDNWQKGIPQDAYMKSGWRHFFEWWKLHRVMRYSPLTPEGTRKLEDALCALLFNVMGFLFEHLRSRQLGRSSTRPADHGSAPSSGS